MPLRQVLALDLLVARSHSIADLHTIVVSHSAMFGLRQQLDRIWTWFHGTPATVEAQAEPSDWCLVGNVVENHEFGESQEVRHGSKHFTPGTKVYCLPQQWGDGYEKVVAVGISRGSRRWITVVMPSDLITNWRAKVVYKPAVMQRLRQGFEGFNQQWKSQEEVELYAELMRRRSQAG